MRREKLWKSSIVLLVLFTLQTAELIGEEQRQVGAVDRIETTPTLRDGSYVLQRGDDISIKVFRVPELDETVRIGPDGRISVLLLNSVEAAGLTVEELRQRLTERYAQYFQEPLVTVIVRGFANQKVYVGGEVGQPGVLPLVGNITALAAVLQAGGFKTSAKKDSVLLIRNNGHDEAIVQKLNLEEVFEKGKPDTPLQPFDVVYVPMSNIANVNQFVERYIRQVLPVPLGVGFNYILGERTTTTVVSGQ